MRTTIEIDNDIARVLRTEATDKQKTFKSVVNKYLRRGLGMAGTVRQNEPYVCPSFALGHPPRMDIDRALELASILETEELVRKAKTRK